MIIRNKLPVLLLIMPLALAGRLLADTIIIDAHDFLVQDTFIDVLVTPAPVGADSPTLTNFPRRVGVTVRDVSGTPAPGVPLLLFPMQGRVFGVQTNSNGGYQFTWQTRVPSDATQWIIARDVAAGTAASQLVDVKPTNVIMTLQPGLTLAINVREGDGKPLAGATAALSIETVTEPMT